MNCFTLKKENDNMLGKYGLREKQKARNKKKQNLKGGIFCDRGKKCYKKVWQSYSRRQY